MKGRLAAFQMFTCVYVEVTCPLYMGFSRLDLQYNRKCEKGFVNRKNWQSRIVVP